MNWIDRIIPILMLIFLALVAIPAVATLWIVFFRLLESQP